MAETNKLLENLNKFAASSSNTLTQSVEDMAKEVAVLHNSKAFTANAKGIYTCEVGDTCPKCNYSKFEEVTSFSGKQAEFFVHCPTCNSYVCRYKPMPHQAMFHTDEHMKKLYAGGFGSAKTYTAGMEFITTVLQIPNSSALVGASTWGQVSDTCLKFIVDNIPGNLVMRSNQDKVNWYIDLINGSRISAKALDKEGKIRSANLTLIWVEEASEVDYSVVAYIAARLRNKNAYFKGKNRLKMILSSNPDVGWLNNKWLMVSDKIYYHGDVKDRYDVPSSSREAATSTHIAATSANYYLPPNYERDLAANKEQWWINRYLKGSFKYTEGLVYPEFNDWFCDPFNVPDHWQRIAGIDFGRRDPTAYVLGAIDPGNQIIYFYKEVYMSLENEDITKVINAIKEAEYGIPEYLWAYPRQGDPRGRNRDQVSGKSWMDAYSEHGIMITPAENMENDSLAPTITKLSTYAKNGKVRFFKTLRNLHKELRAYKYPTKTLGSDKNQGEKPMDSNNHLPDAIRYAMAPLPAFPSDPKEFGEIWTEIVNKTKGYNPLSTEEEDYGSDFIVDNWDKFL